MLSSDNDRPSLQEWLDAYQKLEFNENWRQWEAPCPVCGEKARLEVPNTPNDPPVIRCFNCDPGIENPDAYWAIREVVGLPEKLGERPHEFGVMDSPKSKKRVHNSVSLWKRSVPIVGTPAESYLVRRMAIPPQRDLIPRPENLAWLDREKAPPIPLLVECSGAMIAKYEQNGVISGLEFEGLLSDGRRPEWEGFNRCHGTYEDKKSSVFQAPGQLGDKKRLAVCDNFLSAIALNILTPDFQALALGGASASESIPVELLERIDLIETGDEDEGIFPDAYDELLERMKKNNLAEPEIKTHKSPEKNALDELANIILEGVIEEFKRELDGGWEAKLGRKFGFNLEDREPLASLDEQQAKQSFIMGFLSNRIRYDEDMAPWYRWLAVAWKDMA